MHATSSRARASPCGAQPHRRRKAPGAPQSARVLLSVCTLGPAACTCRRWRPQLLGPLQRGQYLVHERDSLFLNVLFGQ